MILADVVADEVTPIAVVSLVVMQAFALVRSVIVSKRTQSKNGVTKASVTPEDAPAFFLIQNQILDAAKSSQGTQSQVLEAVRSIQSEMRTLRDEDVRVLKEEIRDLKGRKSR